MERGRFSYTGFVGKRISTKYTDVSPIWTFIDSVYLTMTLTSDTNTTSSLIVIHVITVIAHFVICRTLAVWMFLQTTRTWPVTKPTTRAPWRIRPISIYMTTISITTSSKSTVACTTTSRTTSRMNFMNFCHVGVPGHCFWLLNWLVCCNNFDTLLTVNFSVFTSFSCKVLSYTPSIIWLVTIVSWSPYSKVFTRLYTSEIKSMTHTQSCWLLLLNLSLFT